MVAQQDMAGVLAAYFENADYAAANDAAKARAFETACIRLLGLRPTRGRFEDGEYQTTPEEVRRQLDYVRDWLSNAQPAHPGAAGDGSVRYLNTSQWRGYQ